MIRKSWVVVMAVALLLGCGPTETVGFRAPPGGTLERDAICRQFLTAGGTISKGVINSRLTPPPQAEQHLDNIAELRDFGRWARDAGDPAQAEISARIETEADRVLQRLRPDDPDRRTQQLTEALYAATAELYVNCTAELYRELLRTGGVEMDGACAQPGAPKLEGPNVMVYGSNGMFVDPECVLVQGERVGDGCGYSTRGDPAPRGGGAHGSVQVAQDPDTCRALVERGRVKPTD